MSRQRVVALAAIAGLALAATLATPATAVPSATAQLATSPALAVGAPLVEPALRTWAGSPGTFTITAHTRVVFTDPSLAGEAATVSSDLGQLVGHPVAAGFGGGGSGDIRLALIPAAPGNAEGYRLQIGDTVTIQAQNTTGLSHGEQTIEQLAARSDQLPDGTATDWPQVGERGVMIDAGRKYYQPAYIEQLIRTAAWYKLNTVHLHLTEYNAFRLNSPTFPGLAAPQSYDRADIARFERVAAKYHVTIIPEIDLPAHATAITNYWSQTTWDCAPMNNERGHNFTVDVTKPATRQVVKELLDEFIPWFGGQTFDIGTDEYPVQSTQEQCPELVDYAKANHFANTSDVMVDFIDYLNSIVRAHGKTAEAWGWWDAAGSPTISPDKNLVVEAYGNETDFNGRVGAEHFLAEGYQVVYADGNQLYVTPGLNLLPDDQTLYANWPSVSNPELRGYMVSRWSDNTETATDAFQDFYANRPEVVLADRTWGGPIQGTALDLENRVDAIGPPPGVPGPPGNAALLTGTAYRGAGYAGVDVGLPTTVTKVRFLPQAAQPSAMTGGVFQGCTTGPDSGCVTLATVAWNPATEDWRQLAVNDQTAYRWLRFVGAAGGSVEFYRSPDAVASIRLAAPNTLAALGRNVVTGTVTNTTGRVLTHVVASVAVNSADSGISLMAQSRTVPVLLPHGSAVVRWQVDVPPDVVAGDYRIAASVDRANASVLSTVHPTVTTTIASVIAGGTTTLTLSSSAAVALPVRWQAAVPIGISLSPSSGTATIAPGASVSVRVAAKANSAVPGVATVPISMSSGRFGLGGANLLVSVPYADLAGAFDNVGITADGDVNPADLDGGIDGDGSSYSAQALAAAGAVAGKTFAAGGFSFAWPSSTPDNVAADGQTILMGGQGQRLGLLVTASYVAPGTFDGVVTVNYTDGSMATIQLAVPEWQRGYSASADEVITMPYHNYAPVGQVSASTHIFLVSGAIDPAKTIASITLPPAGANRATLHVFAVSSS
ncbi:MAG TPA: beta-N-acetylhexosaminidase [Pseudonocardiaceae bacterium]|nr:beta-N-acetylhexosaminidase [Pseudonocardiaceae bacterium]